MTQKSVSSLSNPTLNRGFLSRTRLSFDQIALQITFSAHSNGGRVGRNENVSALKPFYAFQWVS